MKFLGKTTILGFGAMGKALASGWVSTKIIKRDRITAVDIDLKKFKYQPRTLRIKTTNNPVSVLKGTKLILISVKPQQMEKLLSTVGPLFPKKALVVSIAAGISTNQLEKALPQGCPVIRVMPNTPALLGAGMSAISPGRRANRAQLKLVLSLFSSVGKTIVVKENQMDIVTALSGSGPAYFFRLVEILTTAGKKHGLNSTTAFYLVSQTIYGAAKMILNSGKKPEELTMQVTSPGGTTQAALLEMDNLHFAEVMYSAIAAAVQRSKDLRK